MKLREVITEGGEYHRLGGAGTTAGPGPSVLHYIRKLRTPLQLAFGTVVKAIPKADGAFEQIAGIHVTVAQAAGKKSGRGYGELSRSRGPRNVL